MGQRTIKILHSEKWRLNFCKDRLFPRYERVLFATQIVTDTKEVYFTHPTGRQYKSVWTRYHRLCFDMEQRKIRGGWKKSAYWGTSWFVLFNKYCSMKDNERPWGRWHVGDTVSPAIVQCMVYWPVYYSNPWMWVPVTTSWRVLRLRMEEWPPIWRVAANKSNKQPRTADEGWSSSLGVGRGANNPSP